MDLKNILSISGYPGLYRLVKQGRNAIIVESLETGKRKPAYATSKISALEDIAVYTETEEMPLGKVFKRMYDYLDGEKAIHHKSPSDEVKDFFYAFLPEYDRDRVNVSDMKRIINWYNTLHDLNLLDFSDEEQNETAEGTENEENEGGEENNGDQAEDESNQDTKDNA